METRRLGHDGPELTRVGIGTAPIGSTQDWWVRWGPQDEGDAIRAIHAGLDAGAGWIDTAPFYGWGRGEELVGRALAGRRRDDVLVFTKCGVFRQADGSSGFDLRPATIRAELEASLRRLGSDRVDLIQFHDVDRSTPIEESLGEVARLVEEGKARYVGLSNHSVDLVERALAVIPVTSVQEQYSLLAWERETDVLPFARAQGIGVLAWAPLASGFLTDGFDVGSLAPDDFRRGHPFTRETARIERLRAVAAERGRTLRELAIAWVLSKPAVTAAIVGPRNAREGAEIADGADWALDDDDLGAVETALGA